MKLPRHLLWTLFAVWFAIAVLAVLLFGCTRVIEKRVVVRLDPVVTRCLVQKPPDPVAGTSAELADAYVVLERWVRLYAVPACAAP